MKLPFNRNSKKYSYEGSASAGGDSVIYRINNETGEREKIDKMPAPPLANRLREIAHKIPRIILTSRHK